MEESLKVQLKPKDVIKAIVLKEIAEMSARGAFSDGLRMCVSEEAYREATLNFLDAIYKDGSGIVKCKKVPHSDGEGFNYGALWFEKDGKSYMKFIAPEWVEKELN